MIFWGYCSAGIQLDHHALNSWNPDGTLLAAGTAIHLEDKVNV